MKIEKVISGFAGDLSAPEARRLLVPKLASDVGCNLAALVLKVELGTKIDRCLDRGLDVFNAGAFNAGPVESELSCPVLVARCLSASSGSVLLWGCGRGEASSTYPQACRR